MASFRPLAGTKTLCASHALPADKNACPTVANAGGPHFAVFSHSRITQPTFARLSGEHLSGVSPRVCQGG